ncbi:MAG: type II toxin-antitoxin system RelE/ParE family toxin [Bacteroidota bacterium]|nr:type II toxin-antitoxin system RelE/ParE family toxin [Bacteroidota bacterium]
MAIVIKWTNEARQTFDKNIKYLLEEWTEREIRTFVKQTNYRISTLADQPEMYPVSRKSPKIRKVAINKYVVLYYKYYVSKKEVLLLTFWHNKQDPKKLKY